MFTDVLSCIILSIFITEMQLSERKQSDDGMSRFALSGSVVWGSVSSLTFSCIEKLNTSLTEIYCKYMYNDKFRKICISRLFSQVLFHF